MLSHFNTPVIKTGYCSAVNDSTFLKADVERGKDRGAYWMRLQTHRQTREMSNAEPTPSELVSSPAERTFYVITSSLVSVQCQRVGGSGKFHIQPISLHKTAYCTLATCGLSYWTRFGSIISTQHLLDGAVAYTYSVRKCYQMHFKSTYRKNCSTFLIGRSAAVV